MLTAIKPAIAIAGLLVCCVCTAQEPALTVPEIAAKFAAAENIREVERLYRDLFAAAGPAGLQELTRSEDDSIAIQAAWEEVRLTVPEEGITERESYRPDLGKLNWFLGFLEGRGRVNAPDWWKEMVVDARANRRNNIYTVAPRQKPYHRIGIGYLTGPHDTTLRKDGNRYELNIGADSIILPREVLKFTDEGDLWGSFSGCFTPDYCFLAVHEGFGFPHDVVCINRRSGKVAWIAQACGRWWGGATGRSESWVSVTLQGDRVVVFGASGGFYAHAFRPGDGATIFRFSSNF